MANGKKRFKRGRKKRTNALTKFRRGGNPIPPQMHCVLRYVEDRAIDPLIGAAGHLLYNANGIFDPYFTGVGHQPMGRDELHTFYDHAYVYAAKMAVTFSQISDSKLVAQTLCGIRIQDNSTLITDPVQLRENTRNKWRFLDTDKPITVTKWFYWNKEFRTKYTDDQNQNTIGANPTEDIFFDVWVAAISSTQDPGVINMNVKIDYYTTFTERKTLAKS